MARDVKIECRRIVGLMVLCGLALFCASPALAEDPQSAPCRVMVGPTSDDDLTAANLEWTRHLTRYLDERGTKCDVLFVDAWARANLMFREQQIDVLFPEIVGDPTQPGFTGQPVALTYGFVIFSRIDTQVFDRPSELRGRQVGLIRGRFYPDELVDTPYVDFQEANSLEQNFKKLIYGRIDATVEYRSDGLRQLEAMGLMNRVHHGEEFGVEQLAYRFQATPEGERLQARFDQAIDALMEDGTYAATFGGTSQRLLP
ncbi:MAG: transporter substrate-binding domain-containing protein [Marinobacter sp.]|uniref:substrate-binding periplasmic protein n=1 Tax=Marinobacter sp. TaxID=50741 RepID=UPI00299DC4AF|nr:transporter substrate-binding domain-containing protein [Marinobacter sp.]MDX1756074.1 transporter substrate-binding domain-containing protein [Marinobacter sp.]